MTKTIDVSNMDRNEWLEARRTIIGGSDAGTILGVNKWKTRTQLYFEKVDPTLKQELTGEHLYWGNVLEDVVAQEFAKRTGKKVRKSNKMFIHPEYDFIGGNVDRFVVGEKAILECKTASEYVKDDWKDDEVPASYICQVQHYMAVTGSETSYIAVLIGGNKFLWKEIPRDDEFIEIMLNAEIDFWTNYVKKETIPDIDGNPNTTKFINQMFTEIDDEEIELSDSVDVLLEAVESIDNEIKELEERRDSYKNKVRMELGEHEKGSTNKFRVTWKRQISKRINSKLLKEKFGTSELDDCYNESQSRVFKIKKLEEN